MPGSSRRHSTTPEYSRRDTADRRHSTSSDTSLPDSTHFRQLSQENIEYIPTRIAKVTASKPAANPLQFVKVGPCDLYRSAQEQLKKVEEVKKLKQEKKDEAEDWQSNLDNWKSSRRKRQEHIIERVVEVKKFELEEYDRNRRRSKTFNEMMEERNTRGRKMSLVMYKEEDANDLSDLGIGTSSGKSSISEDFGNDDNQSVSDRDELEKSQYDIHNGNEGKNGLNGHHNDASTVPDVSSPEPEEYTYERAIQNYVDFTETRVKSKTSTRKNSRDELDDSKDKNHVSDKLHNGHGTKNGRSPPPPPAKPRRESNPKIEARLSAIEQRRRSSTDLNSIPDSSRKLPLPKVDVLKRRELFEKASENNTSKAPNKVANTNLSIKERLSNLEKHTDASNNISMGNRRISGTEIASSVKERLSNLQKQRSTDSLNEKDSSKGGHRLSSGDISSSQSIRERLSHLEKQGSVGEEKDQTETSQPIGDISNSNKEWLSNLNSTNNNNDGRRVSSDRDSGTHTKATNLQNTESQEHADSESECNNIDISNKTTKSTTTESERSTSPDEEEIYANKRQQFHRSLDSLDVEGSNDVVNEAFERVQSLEDLDCCSHTRNYPASASSTEMLAFSSQSGDTDREDSGIHTADVSCSVSQADEPVEDGEIITTISSVVPHFGRDSYHLEMELVNHKRQGSGISEPLSPIPQEESNETCTAFIQVESSAPNSLDLSRTVEVDQAVLSSTKGGHGVSVDCSDISVVEALEGNGVLNGNLSSDISVPVTTNILTCPSPVLDVKGDINNDSDNILVTTEISGNKCTESLPVTSSVTLIEVDATNQTTVLRSEKEDVETVNLESSDALTSDDGNTSETIFPEETDTVLEPSDTEIPVNSSLPVVGTIPITDDCSPNNPSTQATVVGETPPSTPTLEAVSPTLNNSEFIVENIITSDDTQNSECSVQSPASEVVSSTVNNAEFIVENIITSVNTQNSDSSVPSPTSQLIIYQVIDSISCAGEDESSVFTSDSENYSQQSPLEVVISAVTDSDLLSKETTTSVVTHKPQSLPQSPTSEDNSKPLAEEVTVLDVIQEPQVSPHIPCVETVYPTVNDSNSHIEETSVCTNDTIHSQSPTLEEVAPSPNDESKLLDTELTGSVDPQVHGNSIESTTTPVAEEKVSMHAKRMTVVELCEKVDITLIGGTTEGLRSPPTTPYISVSMETAPDFQELSGCPQKGAMAAMPSLEVASEVVHAPQAGTGAHQQESCVTEEPTPAINKLQDVTSEMQPTLPPAQENISEQIQNKPTLPARFPRHTSHGTDDSNEEVFLPLTNNQIPPLSLTGNIEIVSGLAFPLGPPTSAEPPKEKPPPPPTELSDEEILPVESTLRRHDSTKRIKTLLNKQRSSFLGIEGKTDDSYLETELQVSPPPDMTSFLVEERRLEQQLYRQSICSESDSNLGENTESRDSGVELERGHSDDTWLTKQPLSPEVLSAQHSRQNSELYGNASITSEEDEIMKKEREIIEILEKEEQWRYGNNTSNQQNNIGEKLAEKLRQLEQEKMRLEWERTEEANRRQVEENARREEEQRLRAKEQELRQQESIVGSHEKQSPVREEEISASGENLRADRERLQHEQEQLMRQVHHVQQAQQAQQRWSNHGPLPTPMHLSLQDVSVGGPSMPAPPQPATVPLNYRLSLPDLQQDPLQDQLNRRAAPPIPPAKPLRLVSQEQRERNNSIRNSRMPSADSIPQQMEPALMHPSQTGGQQMSRQTLQALSAVPRSRLISTDNWIQAKKKPEGQRNTLNNQHWLIQEAEHRRITEQQQRNALSPRKMSPHQVPPHQSQVWGNHQQQSPRQEKPLPDSIIQTLTQRVQNRVGLNDNKKAVNRMRFEESPSRETPPGPLFPVPNNVPANGTSPAVTNGDSQEKMLSVSGKKKCSHCGDELGRGAAMIIESLRLFYHIDCFKCCVCHVQLGDGLMGTDVRVRNNKLHCHNCYSSDDGVKFSCV